MAGADGGPEKPGAEGLGVQRPAGVSNQPAEARHNRLGHLSPESGRQRTPLLPVQRSGGHSPGDPCIRGRLTVAHRNRVRDGAKRRGAGRVRDLHLDGLASPRGFAPVGRRFSTGSATGLGKKDAPDHSAPSVPGGARDAAPGTVRSGGAAAMAGGRPTAQ